MDIVATTRRKLLRFRFVRQGLVAAPDSLARVTDVAALDAGVQDTGPDGSAWALAVRGAPTGARDSWDDDLFLAWTLRGAPFVPDLYGGLGPYLHHPPAGFWLAAMFGAEEWQLRATTLLAHLVATMALVAFVQPLLGSTRALLAGAVLLVLPVFYLDIQASQWPFTIACGLLLLLGFDRQRQAGGRGWRALTLQWASTANC